MDGRQVKLNDFARECGVTERAIQKHLKNLADELQGHYERRGPNGTWLDETAMGIIRSRMVTPPPPIVSDGSLVRENEELRAALMQLQTRHIELQEKMIGQAALLGEAASNKALLEAATERQEALNKELMAEHDRAEKASREAQEAKERAEKAEREATAAAAALEAEKGRKLSFMERLRGKKES